MPTPPDLFISHSSADAAAARELRNVLEEAGYRCWLAPDDVTGTTPWAEQILEAIDASRAMLVIVSARANRSSHVSREVSLASGRGRGIIPVRIEEVPPQGSLEYHLEGMQRIDAFPPPIAAHRERILRRLALVVPLPPGASEAAAVTTRAAGEDGGDAEATQRVRVSPTESAGSRAGPPVRRIPRVRAASPRWLPASSGLSAALIALVAVIALGTGVIFLSPAGGSGTATPRGSETGLATPEPSEPPLATGSPVPTTTPVTPPPGQPSESAASQPSLDPTATPSPTKAGGNPLPDPTPTRTPRPPNPTPTPTKTPKPPSPTPTPTPTPPPASITPARLTSHTNGSTIHGTSETFTWTSATGGDVRFYGLYIGGDPPQQPCTSGWCEEPPDDATASKDIACGGCGETATSVQVTTLPADGSTIYVRLFTKYQPASGRYTWRDYTFTSAP